MVPKVSFADEARQAVKQPGIRCKACTFIATFEPTERAEIEAVIADPSYPAAGVWRALKARGANFTVGSLRNHRNNCGIR